MRYTAIAAVAACCLALSGCSLDETPASTPAPPASAPEQVASTPPSDSQPAEPPDADDHPAAQPAAGKAACRQAIKDQYVPGTLTLKGKPSKPRECDGLSTDEVSEIATSVIEDQTR